MQIYQPCTTCMRNRIFKDACSNCYITALRGQIEVLSAGNASDRSKSAEISHLKRKLKAAGVTEDSENTNATPPKSNVHKKSVKLTLGKIKSF